MGIDGFTVRGDQLYVHAYGKRAPIQLMGARLASAAMRDDWTETLLAWLPEYRRYGVNSAVIFWQGSSGGWTNPTHEFPEESRARYEGNAASFCLRDGEYVFEPDPDRRCYGTAFHMDRGYEVDERVGRRMWRIVGRMNELDMVAVVGIFYFRTYQQMNAQDRARYDFRAAARRAAEHLQGLPNIIWYPYNEYHSHSSKDYGRTLTTEAEIAHQIKSVDAGWLAGGAAPDLDIEMIDRHTYLYAEPADRPLMNVETFGIGAGGNDRFSGRCHRFGIWEEEGYTDAASRDNPATKNDFFREVDGALARPSYHLFAHLQGWYQGGYPGSYGHNLMGMTPGALGGPPLTGINFYNTASPYYSEAVLVDDDNRGQGRWGSRGVRWYYAYLRDHYSTVKYPFSENGAWDLRRVIDEAGA
jgi:hypothetical protein